jgi:hypothetical protein
MTDKHAYLIMAHHRADLLQLIIDAIDDERNDIYIHLDKKSDLKQFMFKVEKAGLHFISSMNVNWAGYTQVECEYRLIKAAHKNGPYMYYHFMTGATFPLKNQDDMHYFFAENAGKEFVGFDNKTEFSDRVRYKFLFCEDGKLNGLVGRIKSYIRECYLFIQRFVNYDRTKRFNVTIKKGIAYWSITDELAQYILSREELVKDMLQYSISGDEVFVQTLVYNSKFIDSVYDETNEFVGASREVAWESCLSGEHPCCNFGMSDYKYLVESQKCFALKFESDDGIVLINKIKNARIIK